jgi:hypothetical protein
MFLKKIFILLAFLPLALWAKDGGISKSSRYVYDYQRSPQVSEEVWQMVRPYLLPSNLPVKKKLDEIFKRRRVLANQESVRKAGFPKSAQRQYSRCTVSAHPYLEGFIIKMFTDDVLDVCDYQQWIHRIEGAKSIQATIDKKGYGHLFKVPKKWIYPLPASPAPGEHGKNFILVAEDMKIYKHEKNTSRWKSDLMNKERANAMYVIMNENGLADSIYPFNIPFCKDGKQAFIDTEYHHRWPIHYEIMFSFFSQKMSQYWQKLVIQGGPKK